MAQSNEWSRFILHHTGSVYVSIHLCVCLSFCLSIDVRNARKNGRKSRASEKKRKVGMNEGSGLRGKE